MTMTLWALCLAGLLGVSVGVARAAPPALTGTVTRVSDGDTLQFKPAGRAPLTLRLRDIDAPELCQPGGEQARQALAELALDKRASVVTYGRDVWGRTVASVSVDGVDLGIRLVEEGHAWSQRVRYDQGPLVKQERMARALGRGLHAQGGAVAPWEFRRSHGPCVDAPVGGPSLELLPAGGAPPAAAPPPAAASPWRCDGRRYCSQMRSCAEAKYFLAHCPGVQMDGDGDGIPCEQQWCRH